MVDFFLSNAAWLLPVITGAGAGGYKLFQWGVNRHVGDDIDAIQTSVDELGSEMTRRFDLMDYRLDDVEKDISEVKDDVRSLSTAGQDRGERIASLEGSTDD